MKNIIKHITFCGLATIGVSMGLSSCEDFLTITPTDKIVEEEFWQDKNDLENAVYGCYKQMAGSAFLNKVIYWGEMRSDNFDASSECKPSSSEANIMNCNLLPTYGIFSWTDMYKAINNCNKVLAHGPEVVEVDESFTQGDWRPIRAEMITMRALCHFYLVRAFGEIPYVTTDYNNDSQELRLPQSTQLAVLDSLVKDLEEVKDELMSDYGKTVLNKGRLTRKAAYALLADVYLWRASYKAGNNHPFDNVILNSLYNGTATQAEIESRQDNYGTTAEQDYEKCVECCDQVISIAKEEMEKYLNDYGYNVGGAKLDLQLSDLLDQNVELRTAYSRSVSSAYNSIFGSGNSEESIFELQVDGSTYGNGMVTSLLYNFKDKKVATFTGSPNLFEAIADNPNQEVLNNVFTKTDYRRWETILFGKALTVYDFGKFVNASVKQSNGTSSVNAVLQNNDPTQSNLTVTQETRSYITLDNAAVVKANFPVYRLSEIYLMKAEAMSQLYEDEENLQKAFNYVREVFKRSNPYAYALEYGLTNTSSTAKDDSLKFSVFNTSSSLENLIMTERQREFVCEGKRWFDLVRYAQRRGNTDKMLEFLTRKYSTNKSSIEAKLANMQSLFCPVYNSELKSNTWLYQNGVWATTESTGRTDNL